jgi:hypothetical protein
VRLGGSDYKEFDKILEDIEFEAVLELFEAHGWRLQKIYEPYRVFVKDDELPWLIPVHERKVDAEYVEKFREFLKDSGEI